MSFVKDDSAYTRGVGAVASMDAASPRRRRAAARAGMAMARRDAIMSRHTLGRIAQTDTSDGGGGSGGGGGGTRPPTTPPPRPGRPVLGGRFPVFIPPKPIPPKPVPPKKIPIRADLLNTGRLPIRDGLQVKSPGSVLPPKADPLPPKTGTAITDAATVGTKAPITIVAGGSGPAWVPPKATPPSDVPSMPEMPEMPTEADLPPDAPIQTAPAKPKSNLLLYAALGIGAYWLLTRKH